MPRIRHLVANPVVQRQLGRYAPVVLSVEVDIVLDRAQVGQIPYRFPRQKARHEVGRVRLRVRQAGFKKRR